MVSIKIECANCGKVFTYVDDENESYGITSETDYHIHEIDCPYCKGFIIIRFNLKYSEVDFNDTNEK